MSARPPESSPAPEASGSGPSRAKARILLPIALSVGALALFLVAFWPASHAGKKARAQRDHGSVRGASPVGGSRQDELEDLGNTPVTKNENPLNPGKTAAGRAATTRSVSHEDGWWYQAKENPSRGRDDQWWYQGKTASGKTDPPPEGRDQEAKATPKSGPDNTWWHD